MAETTGIANAGGSHENRAPASSNPVKGKNKKLIYLGGAGIAILLLGHRGSSLSGASQTDPNAQLQAQADQAAQAAADQALANTIPPGGVAPTTVDTGGGTYNAPGSSIVTSPPNVSVDTGATGGPSGTPDAGELTKADVQGHFDELFPATAGKIKNIDHKINQAPKHTKPKPASKSGHTNHPSEGTKVQGHTGTQVHGRTFPGAKGHSIGPVHIDASGNAHQDVTINYGGHSATHRSVNQGKQWVDNVKGRNPPSRGPQQTVHPTAKPTPARRPAPKRRK